MRIIFGRDPKRTLVRLVCLIVLSVVLFKWILIPIRVSGLSMYPSYPDGKVTMINHLAYKWNTPKRGDVVAVKDLRGFVMLKRVVGLPGEKVWLKKGRVYINGVLLDEPYARKAKGGLSHPEDKPEEEIELDEDSYYILGDNRGHTWLGAVPRERILGKALF